MKQNKISFCRILKVLSLTHLFLKKILKQNKGESMIEIIVAISIIITSLVGIMVLFSDNIKTNQSTKNRIIAINLAREGLEAVRYIRDSNWLVYSNKRRICWNNETDHICTDNDKNGKTDTSLKENYNLNLNPDNFSWSLSSDSDGIDQDDNQLYLKDGFYQHSSTGSAIKTPFMRQIQISYPDGDTTKETDNRMFVKTIVKWGKNEKVELEGILTDFLERKWHDD